jgi:ABC-type nitrate/sulfonate/bicarbonate transport system substrate-binding protein
MNRYRQMLFAGAALIGALALGAVHAQALDKVHAGKAVAVAWAFIPLDVGVKEGIFAKYGLDVDITAFGGDAKLQQGLASGSTDFGLGSGPGMAFAVKGSPVIAVAAFATAPRNISVVVGADSPIKTVKDLRGKLIGVTTAGSLTDWLVHRLAVKEGWGKDGVRTAALGPFETQLSAMRTHQIDGMMVATEAGYLLEEKHAGRIIVGMEKYAPHFHTHVVFARKELVEKNPDLVNRFLKGFFASIAFMKTHKAETSKIAVEVLHETPTVASRTWDYEISMLETDGHFDPQAVEVLKESWVELGTLPTKPSDDQIFTTKFLPVKP